MEDPTLKNRRRKRNDAAVLEDAPSPTQPPLKSVKREEEVPTSRKNAVVDVRNNEEAGLQSVARFGTRESEPLVPSSPEVLQLRQLLIASKQHQLNLEQQLVNASQMLVNWEQQSAAKENMYQRALQAAQESELSAERAEKAEKKIDELKKQLEDERKEMIRAKERENLLKYQLVEEQKTRNRAIQRESILKEQLKEEREERNRAIQRIDNLTNHLEHQHNFTNKKITDLTNQLKEEKLQSDRRENRLREQLEQEREERKRAIQTIDQLKHKLVGLEEGEIVDSEAQIDNRAAESTDRVLLRTVNTTAHEQNIFHLLNSTAKNSISIDDAVEYVQDSFEKCGEKARRRLKQKTFHYDCDLCGVKTPKKLDVATHFLSDGHIEKVRESKASVSHLAVKVFIVSLMQIEKASNRAG